MKQKHQGYYLLGWILSVFFMISFGSAVAEDSFEPNDGVSDAYPIESGVTYESWISHAEDQDYYSFETMQSGNFYITLTSLPGDYDLYLYWYNSGEDQWEIVAFSEEWGLADEEINASLDVTGLFIILIIGYDGAYSDTDSYLLFATFPQSITPTRTVSWGKMKLEHVKER